MCNKCNSTCLSYYVDYFLLISYGIYLNFNEPSYALLIYINQFLYNNRESYIIADFAVLSD